VHVFREMYACVCLHVCEYMLCITEVGERVLLYTIHAYVINVNIPVEGSKHSCGCIYVYVCI
jgi:hypothetical protein